MPEIALKTGPAGQLVSLAEVKLFLGLETGFTAHDSLIEDILIPAAEEAAEAYLWRMIREQVWELDFYSFPLAGSPAFIAGDARKPAVITYTDTDGIEQTVADSVFELVDGRLFLAENQEWPDIEEDSTINIEFERGWPDTGDPAVSTAPEAVKVAVLSHIYRNYETRCGGNSEGFFCALRPYRLFEV